MKVWVWVVQSGSWDETDDAEVYGSIEALLKAYPALEFDAEGEAAIYADLGHWVRACRCEVRC